MSIDQPSRSDEPGADVQTSHERTLLRVKALFLAAGFLSFFLSVYLWFFVDREQGLYVGLWVPSLWSLGALMLATETRRR